MRVETALEQIAEIHEQMARSQVYRGYRAAPSMLAGTLALLAAALQPQIIPQVAPRTYILYWSLVAAVAALVAGSGIIRAYLLVDDAPARRRTRIVVGQLTPALAVGALLALAFWVAGDARLIALLPALWALLFGLGLSASKPFLPRMMGWVALFYILCGGLLLYRAIALQAPLPSPWAIGLPFGAGHLLGGLVLYWNLERNGHGPQKTP